MPPNLVEKDPRAAGVEIHHVNAEVYDAQSPKIPSIIRLVSLTRKIKETEKREQTPETEKDELEIYLVDTQAKIQILKELIRKSENEDFAETLEILKDWEKLFSEVIKYYYEKDKDEFDSKVNDRVEKLKSPNPENRKASYEERLSKILKNPKFKSKLDSRLRLEIGPIKDLAITEFIETANSLNLYKIIQTLEPAITRKFGDKEFKIDTISIKEIKKQILVELKKAEEIKKSENPNLEALRKIDQQIKILLAPILRKIALAYRPIGSLERSEGTSITEVLLKEQAACGGFAEIIKLITEYLGFEGRSVFYPGHVNYEIKLPSGDILHNDSNGNWGINPETGEATGKYADYYKTLQRVEDFSTLSEDEKKIAYRRLNSSGEIEYYLPADGKNYPYLQFGILESEEALIPQAIVNNMSGLFVNLNPDDPDEGFYFINQVILENNSFGTNLMTEISYDKQTELFNKMLEQDHRTIFTCQSLGFIEAQINNLPKEEKIKLLNEGQKYLTELVLQDSEFFIFLKLHANLYLFESMLLKEGVGNSQELKEKIQSAVEIYEAEIKKYPIQEGSSLNREYQEKINKIQRKIDFLKELFQNL